MPQLPVKSHCAAMLLALALSLPGCATNLPPPTPSLPVLPARPSLTEPLPLQTYSSSAQADMARWRRRLTDTPLMRDGSGKGGR